MANHDRSISVNHIVSNKAKRRISKTEGTIKQSMPNFPRNKHFLPSDTHTYVSESGDTKCLFIRKFDALYFIVTSVLTFVLLPCYHELQSEKLRILKIYAPL